MAGVAATYGPGTPLKIGQDHIWRGRDKTNGFLMRNVDGRVPALKESFSRVDIGAGNVISAAGAVPYGNGLWRDISTMDVDPGVVKTEKPAVGILVGIAEFNQGWQTGHPVQGWGVPTFGRADMIRKGYVGYKVAMTAVGQEANYLAYLQGDTTQDIATVRTVYDDWLAAYVGDPGATVPVLPVDGSKLALFFGNTSGFPIISVVSPVSGALPVNPALTGATFAGYVEIFEPENEAVFVTFGL